MQIRQIRVWVVGFCEHWTLGKTRCSTQGPHRLLFEGDAFFILLRSAHVQCRLQEWGSLWVSEESSYLRLCAALVQVGEIITRFEKKGFTLKGESQAPAACNQ